MKFFLRDIHLTESHRLQKPCRRRILSPNGAHCPHKSGKGFPSYRIFFGRKLDNRAPETEQSKEIKYLDILDRPNRQLQIYGELVRLVSRRRANVVRF